MVCSFPKATSFRNMMPMLLDGCTANTIKKLRKIILEIKKVPMSNVYHITNFCKLEMQGNVAMLYLIKLYMCFYCSFSFEVCTDAKKVPFLTIARRFYVFRGKIDSPAHTSTRMGHNTKAALQNGCNHCHVCSMPKQLPVLQCIIFPEALSLHKQIHTRMHTQRI